MQFRDNSLHLLRMWRANARASLVREMEFRANFFMSLLRQLIWLGAFLLTIEVVFQNTESLAGWSKAQVLIVLALSRLMEGIMDTLFSRNIADLPQLVQKGGFDFNLIKPGSSQFHTAFRRIHIHNLIGHVLYGLILLIYALVNLPAAPSWQSWVTFIILVFFGLVIFYSLFIIVGTISFYAERLQALWSFINMLTEPLTTPFDVFPHPARITLTYLIPIGFLVFVPAQALIGRLHWWQVPVAMGLAALFLVLANLAWRAGLRRYSSASS